MGRTMSSTPTKSNVASAATSTARTAATCMSAGAPNAKEERQGFATGIRASRGSCLEDLATQSWGAHERISVRRAAEGKG